MYSSLPDSWRDYLAHRLPPGELERMLARVEAERQRYEIYPPANDVFRAFHLTPPERTRVVILGQDPYHGPGQAHGLAFSVAGGKFPPSLRNIFRELEDDLGIKVTGGGDLSHWAEQGVLLLNAVLTVREGEPASHAGLGWEAVTDAVIDALSDDPRPRIFVLWGAHAQKKRGRIAAHHVVIESAHPSPLSARRGFFGSRPFSRINAQLRAWGQEEIDWRL